MKRAAAFLSLSSGWSRERWIVTLFVVLSRGLTLFNEGIYWDDWPNLFNPYVAWEEFFELGLWFKALIHFLIDEPLAYQAVKFVSVFLTAHLMLSILQWVQRNLWAGMDCFRRVIITSGFVLFPSNSSQVGLTFTLTSLGLLLFFFAFYLLLLNLDRRKLSYRLISLAAFFVSFQTESLLVFYAVPMMVVVLARHQGHLLKTTGYVIGQFWDFLLLPFGYWILKVIAFGPGGRFETYNAVQWPAMVNSPRYAWAAFKTSLGEAAAPFVTGGIAALSILAILTFLAIRGLKPGRLGLKAATSGLGIGSALFFLGVFPYIAAGHGPVFEYEQLEWYTRNEVLIPIAAGVLVTFGVGAVLSLFKKGLFQEIAFSVLLGGFLLAQIQNCLEFQRDWFKQLAIVEHLQEHPAIRDHTAFLLIEDRAVALDAMQRVYRPYELDGFFRLAFEDRRPRSFQVLTWAEYIDILRAAQYTAASARPLYVRIEPGQAHQNLMETAVLLGLRYYDPAAFRVRLLDVVNLVLMDPTSVSYDPSAPEGYGVERRAYRSL